MINDRYLLVSRRPKSKKLQTTQWEIYSTLKSTTMASIPSAPAPKNGLGYHRILSPSAGIRVSLLCLGTMDFGEAWQGFMGECSQETAFGILDHFYENEGNFIDTANNHRQEESEKWIGEWMNSRGVRDHMVVAMKAGP